MRKPQKTQCAKSARFPRGVKFFGPIEYRGRQRWVGTYATKNEWMEAAHAAEASLREEWGGPDSPGRREAAQLVRAPDRRGLRASPRAVVRGRVMVPGGRAPASTNSFSFRSTGNEITVRSGNTSKR